VKKLRKTFGDPYQPEIKAIMRLIETQSKPTLVDWILTYAEKNYLPLVFGETDRIKARNALTAAREWSFGKIKLPEAKIHILACHEAAREAEDRPAEQAALRAIGQAASTIHAATHALSITFYGAAAVAYGKAGLAADAEAYGEIASEEFLRIYESLKAASVENEPNPVKVNWKC
jgi:hypothetical protein